MAFLRHFAIPSCGYWFRNSFILWFTHWLIGSLIHWFMHRFINSLIHWFVCSLIYWVIDTLVPSLFHYCTDSVIRSFIRWFIQLYMYLSSFIHWFTHWVIDSLTHWFIGALMHSFIVLLIFIRSFAHSLMHSFPDSLIPWFTHSVIHSLIHSFVRLFDHSFIRSFRIHSLIHSFVRLFILSFSFFFFLVLSFSCFFFQDLPFFFFFLSLVIFLGSLILSFFLVSFFTFSIYSFIHYLIHCFCEKISRLFFHAFFQSFIRYRHEFNFFIQSFIFASLCPFSHFSSRSATSTARAQIRCKLRRSAVTFRSWGVWQRGMRGEEHGPTWSQSRLRSNLAVLGLKLGRASRLGSNLGVTCAEHLAPTWAPLGSGALLLLWRACGGSGGSASSAPGIGIAAHPLECAGCCGGRLFSFTFLRLCLHFGRRLATPFVQPSCHMWGTRPS